METRGKVTLDLLRKYYYDGDIEDFIEYAKARLVLFIDEGGDDNLLYIFIRKDNTIENYSKAIEKGEEIMVMCITKKMAKNFMNEILRDNYFMATNWYEVDNEEDENTNV
jgi:hypothetical protein